MNEIKRNIFVEIAEKAAFGIGSIIITYLFLLSIFSTCFMWFEGEGIFYLRDVPVLTAVGLIGLLFLLFKSRNTIIKIKENQLILPILTIIWFILLTCFVINTKAQPAFDQEQLYDGAFAFVKGDYTMWQEGGYFYLYPLNNGPMIIYILLAWLFRGNLYGTVQGLHILLYFFMAGGMLRLAGALFDALVARIAYIVTLFFLPLWGYVKFMYGNLPGLAMGIWPVFISADILRTDRDGI